jgi:hypothetical protein
MATPIIPWIGGKPAERRELVIWSWDQAAEPAGLF